MHTHVARFCIPDDATLQRQARDVELRSIEIDLVACAEDGIALGVHVIALEAKRPDETRDLRRVVPD